MAAPFRVDRTWGFPVPTEDLWAALTRTDEYRRWWVWLRDFEADGIRPGVVARCRVKAPLPYSLRCEIRVERVVPGALIDTTVSGDVRGPARLEIASAPYGSTARLVSSLEVCTPVLGRVASVGRPLMAWAHNAVVETGVEQFRRQALTRHGLDRIF
jgi:uncharacterized protein YndB with AHSA1/START domain